MGGNAQLVPDFNLYRYLIASGSINGASNFDAHGEYSTSSASTVEDVWLGPTAKQPGPVELGFQPNLISSSEEDGAGSSTGILTMRVYYLNTNGDTKSEDVTLTGDVQKVMVADDVMFIQCAHALTTGSTGKAVGSIDIRNSTTVYKRIAIGKARCLSSTRMVPRGKCLYIDEWGASAETKSSGRASVTLEATSLQGVIVATFIEIDSVTTQNNAVFKTGHPSTCIPELTLIKCTAVTTQESYIAAGWSGWLQDA